MLHRGQTSDSLINAFIYVPMLIEISFLILFISTFTISFYKWQKNLYVFQLSESELQK